MTLAGFLLVSALAAPVAMIVAYLRPASRERVPGLLPLAPVPGLLASIGAQGGSAALPPALLRLTLALDVPGAALLLGVASLLWITAGIYAAAWLRGQPDRGRFVIWWLLTLTGSLGVFMAADLVSFYFLFSVVSLAAYGLIVHDGSAGARRAGSIYVALAVLGEAFLLLGFVFLADGVAGGSLLIRDAVGALPTSPWRAAALLMLMLGFGIKIGLVPVHEWMPVAYSAAPIPAAAVLSGAGVKAGVIGFLRFLPFGLALPGWGASLTDIGLFSAFFGVVIGITQSNPKTVLAYSSISQMGLLAAVIGMGMSAGDTSVAVAVAFYAAHHVLVKGGLFLAVGVGEVRTDRRLGLLLGPAAFLALGLAGLPLTGGALAKLAIKGPLGGGVVGLLGALSAAGTALLMLHFLQRLRAYPSGDASGGAAGRLLAAWLATAVAAVAVPWLVYAFAWGNGAAVLAPGALAAAIWPLLLGVALFLALRRFSARVPSVPAGDILALAGLTSGAIARTAAAFERLDEVLRQWPVAAAALLASAIVMSVMMFAA